jgi:glycosyltransferase involved in cell wall biosynthesis
VLIDAIALLARDGVSLTATIVGDGPDRATFESNVAAHNLGASVRFAGALPARSAFTLGRILVVPSRAESLPYVILEAAGAGLPIIATRVGGIPEILGPDARVLVPPGDSAALAGAILAALRNRDAYQLAALRLKERIRTTFSVDAMTNAVIASYRDALTRHDG